MAVDRNIDFQALAQAIKTNGDFRIAPQTEIRMGQVVGYDPNWDSASQTHGWPLVSIYLYGDTKSPVHRVRFSEWYVPNIGDTVWVALSGPDIWVMGALAGNKKNYIGQLRSPVSILASNKYTDTTTITATSTTGTWAVLTTCSAQTPYLPNRLYRVEASLTFTVSGTVGLMRGGQLSISATANGTDVNATSGFVSVAAPTVTAQAGTGVPTTRNGTGSGASGVAAGPLLSPMSIVGNFPSSTTSGTWSNTNPTPYTITAPRGRLDLLQAALQTAIDEGGNLYISYFGCGSGTQIIGCNWGSSTTSASHTGTMPPGYDASAGNGDQVNFSGLFTSNGVPPQVANNYQIYLNYENKNSSDNNVTIPIVAVRGNTQAFAITSSQGAITYNNSKLNVTNPTITVSNNNGGGKNEEYSKVSIGVISPGALNGIKTGANQYEEIATLDVTGAYDGQYFTITGSYTFWDIPSTTLTPKVWNGGQGPEFTWQLAMKELGTSNFTINNVSQQMFVYDCGVAS